MRGRRTALPYADLSRWEPNQELDDYCTHQSISSVDGIRIVSDKQLRTATLTRAGRPGRSVLVFHAPDSTFSRPRQPKPIDKAP
jgi:hypothetical protein